MAPVEAMGVVPGMRVLDLCAAPGGKSTQIADKLMGEGILVTNEIHPTRSRILLENIPNLRPPRHETVPVQVELKESIQSV